jgi:cyclomaltodextrinase
MKLNQVKGDHLDFVRSGAIYQIFADRFARDESVAADRPIVDWQSEPTPQNFFGGNLNGITNKLDLIASLGVGNLYLNPIFRAPSNHRYDTENYFEIDPLLGSNEDLRSLTREAAGRGVGVILDGVFNHCGRTMPEFQAALAGDEQLRKLFYIYPDGSYQTFGGTEFMPKLNTSEPLVLDYVESVLRHWHEYGIAGWRFDVPYKFSEGFMTELRKRTSDLSSAKYFIAEAWNEWSFASDFEAVQNYRSGYRIADYVHKHSADAEDFIQDIIRWGAGWPDFSVLPNFIDSHDTARFATIVEGRQDSYRLGFALHMLIPGVPVVFAGTELALQGQNDPGCRVSYPTELSAEQQDTFEFSSTWMRLRHDLKSLTHGGISLIELKNHALLFERTYDDQKITVLVNTGYHDELLNSNISGTWTNLNHKSETLSERVPERSLFYRIN